MFYIAFELHIFDRESFSFCNTGKKIHSELPIKYSIAGSEYVNSMAILK